MKTGSRCGADRCTGGAKNLTEENEPTGLEVCCDKRVIHATKTTRVETPPPRKGAVWKGCAALKDGRNGEKCKGSFACFQETTERNCLERVACGESVFGADKLLRYRVCDEVSTSPSVPKSEKVYTDCAGARDARPLNRCSGTFLCAVSDSMREIPRCNHRKGYCPDDWGNDVWTPLLYCDGETVHLFSFSTRV